MKIHYSVLSFFAIALLASACSNPSEKQATGTTDTVVQPFDSATALLFPAEKHFRNVQQLTFGGDNAEAYWSFDSKKIVFQRTDHKEVMCDQIFFGVIPADSTQKFDFKMVSAGKGRTTCSYFMPGDSTVLYASTHLTQDTCPPVPDREKIKKYVWPLYKSFEIYVAGLDGSIQSQLTKNKFYDAEATVSPKGDKIIFTSTRDGDLDLYTMNLDGSNVKRITKELGYDGGAWFSPDGTKIVWRASRPTTPEAIKEYNDLLKQDLVAPTQMTVFVADADGSNIQQVTNMPGANWAPVFTPDGKRILFASNHEYPRGFPFNLYLINLDGTGLEKISGSNMFDAFAMFSPDGKKLVFCSNRNNGGTRDTNVFIADWVD
ncbi:MAG: PD40 domain-containing protein [Chitinophagaceae bacterium]|nr:PD40 domain-containing protein [Chitinophagaceae bacterium]